MNNLINKVIFGGLYKVPDNQWCNDQSNHVCVPVVDENGNLWMQDTYQIQRPSMKPEDDTVTDSQIRVMISYGDGKHSWCLNRARSNYYYRNQTMITREEQLSRYELIADLRECRGVIKGEDYRDYKDEDVIHGVKLFFEHGYSWTYGNIGATVIRKDAVKNNVALLSKYTQDLFRIMKQPHSSQWYAKNVYDAIGNVDDIENNADVINRAKYALKLHDKLCEMEKEYSQFLSNAAKEEYGIEY